MAKAPHGWKVTHHGKGRGVFTRVEFADGRGINFSGRWAISKACDMAAEQLLAWSKLDMTDEGLAAFNSAPVAPSSVGIRFKELKDKTDTNRRPFLFCPVCMERFSANAGDYFLVDPEIVIEHCGVPMKLVTEHAILMEVA